VTEKTISPGVATTTTAVISAPDLHRVWELLTQATQRVTGGDVVGARDLLTAAVAGNPHGRDL